MTVTTEEACQNIRTVKAFSNESEESAKFHERSMKVNLTGRKKALMTGIQSMLSHVFLYLTMAAVLFTSKRLFQAGKIKIGNISSFMMYVLAMLWQFMIISWSIPTFMNLSGACEKLVAVMNAPVMIKTDGTKTFPETQGAIELRDVKFCYPSKPDVPVLKGVSFKTDMQTKRVVALCGHSGCGKSSIISLIERFYDATGGEILFNGHDIRELDNEWYHRQVGIV